MTLTDRVDEAPRALTRSETRRSPARSAGMRAGTVEATPAPDARLLPEGARPNEEARPTAEVRPTAEAHQLPEDAHLLPRIIADGSDLDNLELALNGSLPGIRLSASTPQPATARFLLADAENTPLAIFDGTPDRADASTLTGTLTALRPPRMGLGEATDPRLRLEAARVRRIVDRRSTGEGALAVVFREVPTRDDLRRVRRELATRRPAVVLWTAVVSRRPQRRSPDDNGVVRAVMAAKPAGAIALVVPAPDAEATVIRPSSTRGIRPDAAGEPADPLRCALSGYGALEAYEPAAARRTDGLQSRDAGPAETTEPYPAASARELERARRRSARSTGAVILFTGLSGSGKSTIAHALAERIDELADRPATLLDGDEVRRMLSSELGFDRHSRETNLQRIGYVAALVARAGGIAIAAPIAPFDASRQEIRRSAEQSGAFLLVHVSTPLEVCEARDRKGLYAEARAGRIPDFTGISSPYEAPEDADVMIDTAEVSVEHAVRLILAALRERLTQEDRALRTAS